MAGNRIDPLFERILGLFEEIAHERGEYPLNQEEGATLSDIHESLVELWSKYLDRLISLQASKHADPAGVVADFGADATEMERAIARAHDSAAEAFDDGTLIRPTIKKTYH